MLKNKNMLISVVAVACALLALILSMVVLSSLSDVNARLDALTTEILRLQEQLSNQGAPTTQPQDPYEWEEPVVGAVSQLMVSGWEAENGRLVLTEGHAMVSLPVNGLNGQTPGIQSSRLVMRMDQQLQECGSASLNLVSQEDPFVFESSLNGVSMELPQLEDGQMVDVWLEVVLSDGQTLVSLPASWYMVEGILELVVG